MLARHRKTVYPFFVVICCGKCGRSLESAQNLKDCFELAQGTTQCWHPFHD